MLALKIIGVAILCAGLAYLYFSNVSLYREQAILRFKISEDNKLLAKLDANKLVNSGFSLDTIGNRKLYYKEIDDKRLLLLKIKKGQLRVGLGCHNPLNKNNPYETIVADLGKITKTKGKEDLLGSEPFFLFKAFSNWNEKSISETIEHVIVDFDSWIPNTKAFKKETFEITFREYKQSLQSIDGEGLL